MKKTGASLPPARQLEDVQAASLLVVKGRAKVNTVNPNLKITPIQVAARKGNAEIMK